MEYESFNWGAVSKTEIDGLVTYDKKYTLTEERYKGILKFREKFFNDDTVDAAECPFLPPEVAASWNRSRKFGANAKEIEYNKHLSSEEYEKVLKDSRSLIDITNPLFTAFKDLATFRDNAIYLFHATGIALIVQRTIAYIPIPENCVWDEKTAGTSSHALCMYLKSPVQLLGLEYYSEGFARVSFVVSSAPILNERGEVLGCIAFRQDLPDPPWEKGFQALRSHTLGLIYSMAIAVENGLKLRKSHDFLKAANYDLKTTKDSLANSYDTLKASWSLIGEGIILIDQTGKIIHINNEGSRILKINTQEKDNKNIKEFLIKHSQLLPLVKKGKNIDIEETICAGHEEQNYLVSIRPVLNHGDTKIGSAVLRLTPIEQIDALLAKRSGALASYKFEDIMGENKIFTSAIATAQRFAGSQQNILLSGESGTGKELFAHAIHNNYRPQGPFIAVNCSAIPRDLIESELMGYEGGSFTGSDRSGRPGKIELANGGTLLLDEIADMPFELQAVLLRVLEDKKIMRLGGRSYKKVDFKLIAATNKDLYELVRHGLFREDLYYRLSVLTILIPALRERGNDLELLSQYFMESYCKKEGRPIPQLHPATLNEMKEYKWPGNVRQLENAIIYAINVATGGVITPANLPNYVKEGVVSVKKDSEKSVQINSLKDSEKEILESALAQAKYNVRVASSMLNISKPSLYRKLKKYGIEY
jgi:sigma-54 dependent transcriptional regulator, acetoin dehydrogenase operon transcriptional activator AcoR